MPGLWKHHRFGFGPGHSNPALSLDEGAVEPWRKPQHEWAQTELKRFAKTEGIPMDVPFLELSADQRKAVVEGKGKWTAYAGFMIGSKPKNISCISGFSSRNIADIPFVRPAAAPAFDRKPATFV